jgi:protein TonB
MTYSPRWRKAMIVSIVFHIVFLSIVGWLAGSFFAAMESEPYVELELLTDVSMEDSESDTMSAAKSAPQAVQAETMQAIKSTAALPDAPKVVAAADDLAVVAVDEAAVSPSASNNDSASNSSAVSAFGGSGNGNGENDKGATAGTGNGSGNGSGKKGSIVRPRILSKVEPTYPESARRAGQEGTAVVRIQILANGLPGDVTINTTSGYDLLDDAAVAAVQKWRFIPAKSQESGASIMCYTTMPVSFRLK